MAENNESRVNQLLEAGQSIWLDSIQRGQIRSGELKKLVEVDGLRGETANPSIFQKAVDGSSDYDDQIRELATQGFDANGIYERIATDDVRSACDVFRPLYEQSNGADGFVSLEVSPKLAYNTEGTQSEVRRFWEIVDRPNLMIKIPGTPQGVPAIEESLYEGININITLLFAVEAYEKVAWAFVRALERRAAEGKPIDRIASVASFFISRIDTLADKLLDERIKQEHDPQKFEELNDLKGKVAIANAKVAYERFLKIFGDPRFEALKANGARVQRPLWASTSTKNPAYSDVMYVESLIGPDTINTLPLETIQAFEDHGKVERTVDKDLDAAHTLIKRFERTGLILNGVTSQVLKEGVEKFDESLDKLLKVIDDKGTSMQVQTPMSAAAPVTSGDGKKQAEPVKKNDLVSRIWQRDPTLWSPVQKRQQLIRNRLGWLGAVKYMRDQVGPLQAFAQEIVGAGFKHVLLLGMGGSSLAAEVMHYSFGIGRGQPNFQVLDTTDPATVRESLREMRPSDTLYLVSSKSGTTLETLSLYKYFYGHVHNELGDKAGQSFVAITDPGTSLERVAVERGFRHIFLNPEDIGGRFSALSYFGLVPGALMGIDISKLLDQAEQMMQACGPESPDEENPGLWLGTALADSARAGRNKVTFVLSPRIDKFGPWLEQLLAESTGKAPEAGGVPKGLLPIDGEPLGAPESYGDDRVFVYLRIDGDATAPDQAVEALEKARHPVIRLHLKDVYSLGGEFFRWEFATAVAAAQLGVNPFDEPNVTETKQNTRRMLDEYKLGCKLPEFGATCTQDGFSLFWNRPPQKRERIQDYIRDFISQARGHDYIALMAYLTHSPANDKIFAAMRTEIRAHSHSSTTVGYGPRFLHSTGQFHKGGDDQGLFIQITSADTKDLNIPGEEYTFGVLKHAEAIGDFQALENHNRRVMRLNLAEGTDVSQLKKLFDSALAPAAEA